ncbi:MAG: hypothetical protein Hens3KO_25780 [Henriciella sp.]
MTATQTAPFGFPNSALAFLRRIAGFAAKTLLALAIIFAAGIIAIATAAAGIALATLALMMSLFGARRERGPVGAETEANGLTLEARRTAHGWTVE